MNKLYLSNTLQIMNTHEGALILAALLSVCVRTTLVHPSLMMINDE